MISVKISPQFLSYLLAKVAQLVEHNVANVRVVGSNPIFRSKFFPYNIDKDCLKASYPSGKGAVCKTVMHQFESGRRLNRHSLSFL